MSEVEGQSETKAQYIAFVKEIDGESPFKGSKFGNCAVNKLRIAAATLRILGC
jgi:hypothetical protein